MTAIADGLGFDGARLDEAARDPAVSQRCEADTDRAIAAGVFGAPFN